MVNRVHCLRYDRTQSKRCRSCKAYVESQGYEAERCPSIGAEETPEEDYENYMARLEAEHYRDELAQAIAWSEMGFEGTGV